jgi:nucleotide-binding universal stress UspA family protein
MTLRHILVPMDLAAIGESKLAFVEQYARTFDADVLVLHVLPHKLMLRGVVSAAEAAARSFLDMVVARLRAAGVRAESLIQAGPVARVIVDEATRQQVDLIILGANVRTSVATKVAGSIADRVVRSAPCPVLLVPPPPASHTHYPLWSFKEASERAGTFNRRRLGLRTVPLARIVGSVERSSELGHDFRPLRRARRAHDDERFAGVLAAMQVGLPPVDLYKFGFGYYVSDGHHRIAAARALGQLEVEADVTDFVPVSDRQPHRVFVEQRRFELATGLKDIEAVRSGTYPLLGQLIADYARGLGLSDLPSAAVKWQSEVFGPLWQRSHDPNVRRLFPGDRGADIIARLATWRAAVGNQSPDWPATFDQFLAVQAAGS